MDNINKTNTKFPMMNPFFIEPTSQTSQTVELHESGGSPRTAPTHFFKKNLKYDYLIIGHIASTL